MRRESRERKTGRRKRGERDEVMRSTSRVEVEVEVLGGSQESSCTRSRCQLSEQLLGLKARSGVVTGKSSVNETGRERERENQERQ
jgi:hypothetical protein